MVQAQEKKYGTFREFYPFYLSEHRNPVCRRLHFTGSWLALGSLAAGLLIDWRFLFAALLFGYGFAWAGHFFFEKNKPATFRYPFYSFAGDWVMFWEILNGKIRL